MTGTRGIDSASTSHSDPGYGVEAAELIGQGLTSLVFREVGHSPATRAWSVGIAESAPGWWPSLRATQRRRAWATGR